MLAIRLQRTGRKGHAQFRMIVQDSRRTPTSGNIVAALGNYDPHTQTMAFEKEKVSFYLEHGAQPSDRVARLLKKEGVKLPKWVKLEPNKKRTARNPEKLRKNRPAPTSNEAGDRSSDQGVGAGEPAPKPVEKAPAQEADAEEVAQPEVPETGAEEGVETPDETAEATESEETPAETPTDEPADTPEAEKAADTTEKEPKA